jgi:hypothetical protein
MGREAQCECESNGARYKVKALVEPPELILRGEIRRQLPFSGLKEIRADGEALRFVYGSDRFALMVGRAMAEKWAKALTTPPPTLAKKLGIAADTVVRMIGAADDDALRSALDTAKAVSDKGADLILARVDTPAELTAALRTTAKQLAARVPIWFIYPKGRGHALTENDVRSTALAAGVVDTKVCSVSPALTAMRFVPRTDH